MPQKKQNKRMFMFDTSQELCSKSDLKVKTVFEIFNNFHRRNRGGTETRVPPWKNWGGGTASPLDFRE